METHRDDFGIAIRSAFLQKGTRQKFSLFALIVISIVLLFVEKFENKPLDIFRALINDGIYRGSYFVSMPNKFFSYSKNIITNHFDIYKENKELKDEKKILTKKIYEVDFLRTENAELKKLLDDKSSTSLNLITAKVILDKDSPFINSVIINKGSNAGIKKGMAVIDYANLVGRIVEVNYLSSRVLLLKDLNSRIPVVIVPQNYHSIMIGKSNDLPSLKFLPEDNKLISGEKIYTSGKDGVIQAGIPIGQVFIEDNEHKVKLFSNSTQINFVNVIKGEY